MLQITTQGQLCAVLQARFSVLPGPLEPSDVLLAVGE